MVRYLKYIVAIFGTIGLLVGSFFYYQNRVDISQVLTYRSTIDFDYQKENCPSKDDVYPCLKTEFSKFLKGVSLTGTSMGLKMMFNVMDELKYASKSYKNDKIKNLSFTLKYLEINNMAMDNAYRRYFGFKSLYGGFISSLENYYSKAYVFSDNLIIGLSSSEGIQSISDEESKALLEKRFENIKASYYRIKEDVERYRETEEHRLSQESKS